MRAERYVDPRAAVSTRVEIKALNELGGTSGNERRRSPHVVMYRNSIAEFVLSVISPTEAEVGTRYQSFVINADQLELLATGILEIAARVRLGVDRGEH